MAAPAHIARENGKKGGRPLGSTTRPQIRDYMSDDEVRALVERIKKRALKDDTMARFLHDHIFGKAPQGMELSGPEGTPLSANLSKSDRTAIDNLRHLLKQSNAQ